MKQINAVITGVGGYVPDYILTNDEISRIVDTTDEWIMGRIGIKERRILNDLLWVPTRKLLHHQRK